MPNTRCIRETTMRGLLMLVALASASGFTGPSLFRLRTDGTHVKQARCDVQQKASALRLSASEKGKEQDEETLNQTVDSFTDLVKRVTGERDYQFGDLSKLNAPSATQNANGGDDAAGGTSYKVGRFTKSSIVEVQEWARRRKKSIEAATGKEYEFGDISKLMVTKAGDGLMKQARKAFGEDYQFGDLTRSAVKKVQNYRFGDITRGFLKGFNAKDRAEEEANRTKEEATLHQKLVDMENKALLSRVLEKGTSIEAETEEVQELLLQEMSYLESLLQEGDTPEGKTKRT